MCCSISLGSQLVTWLIRQGDAFSVAQAVAIGQRLVRYYLVRRRALAVRSVDCQSIWACFGAAGACDGRTSVQERALSLPFDGESPCNEALSLSKRTAFRPLSCTTSTCRRSRSFSGHRSRRTIWPRCTAQATQLGEAGSLIVVSPAQLVGIARRIKKSNLVTDRTQNFKKFENVVVGTLAG